MHRDRAVEKTLIVGTVLMVVVVLTVHLVPAFQAGNLFPVAASLAGALTGFLFARAAREAPPGRRLTRGAAIAGLTGALGALGFSALGYLPIQNLLIAGLTNAVAGAVGAGLSSLVTRARGGPPLPSGRGSA
jgi:hypothetical protein